MQKEVWLDRVDAGEKAGLKLLAAGRSNPAVWLTLEEGSTVSS
jgi:hypothetical protein